MAKIAFPQITHFLLVQAFAGLEQTGELDDETVELMNTPRCGVSDVVGHGSEAGSKRRKKRYALQGSRWRTRTLTYRITKYPSTGRLSKQVRKKALEKQFCKNFIAVFLIPGG